MKYAPVLIAALMVAACGDDGQTPKDDAALQSASEAAVHASASPGEDARPELTAADITAAQAELRRLHDELMAFRHDATFHEVGFGRGGPYAAWQDQAQALSSRIVLAKVRVAPEFRADALAVGLAAGYLVSLGTDLMRNKGQMTEFGTFAKHEIGKALPSDMDN